MLIFSRTRKPFGTPKPRPPRAWLRLEALEDRRVPATLQVTSPLDDGSAATLRYAVLHASTGDKIVLKGAALGGITLTQGELRLKQKNVTIQTSSDQDRATVSGGGLSRVFEVATGASVNLSNLIVTGGNAQSGVFSDPHEGRGGGIVVDEGGSLTMTGSTVTNNSAPPIPLPDNPPAFKGGLGGGIADYGTLTMNNCAVTANHALGTFGGGIAVFSGDPFSAPFSASLSIKDSTVSGNTARQNGGGITGVASTITLDDCDVTGNSTSLYDGGGLNNHGGTMTISHSRVANNTAAEFGGGMQNFAGGTLTINDSVVDGNTSRYVGGGIDNGGSLALKDSVLSNNRVPIYNFGGGIFNRNSGAVTMKRGSTSCPS